MFRASQCSSSGDRIVLTAVPSYRHTKQSHRLIIPDDILIQFDLLMMSTVMLKTCKGKGVPRQAEVAQGVPGRLRLRIILTFRHYKGGRSLAKTPAAFTPGEIPGTHFQRLSGPQGTWFCRGYHGKNPQ